MTFKNILVILYCIASVFYAWAGQVGLPNWLLKGPRVSLKWGSFHAAFWKQSHVQILDTAVSEKAAKLG